MDLKSSQISARSLIRTLCEILREIWTQHAWYCTFGYTVKILSVMPFKPSEMNKRTSSTPRSFRSSRSFFQINADSVGAIV